MAPSSPHRRGPASRQMRRTAPAAASTAGGGVDVAGSPHAPSTASGAIAAAPRRVGAVADGAWPGRRRSRPRAGRRGRRRRPGRRGGRARRSGRCRRPGSGRRRRSSTAGGRSDHGPRRRASSPMASWMRASFSGSTNAGRLVEHDHRRVLEDGPGQGQALALAARQPVPRARPAGSPARRQRLDDVEHPGRAGRGPQLVRRGARAADPEVGLDGVVEQERRPGTRTRRSP